MWKNLETKLEMLRSRSEEVTSNTSTDAQAKLLRQVETLQTQYALASENWQALESTLNARLAALEKERDDIAKREADVRKKAREVNGKARRLEDELESEKDKASTIESDLAEQKASLARLQTRLDTAEAAVQEARAESARERKVFEKELQSKIDEEKTKWKLENNHSNSVPPTPTESSHFLRAESPSAYFAARKPSATDLRNIQGRRSNAGSKTFASDLPSLFTDHNKSPSRRPSTIPHHSSHPFSATPSRQDSTSSMAHVNGNVPISASVSVAPSIDAIDDNMDRDSTSSPHRTVNELISVSAMNTGPSVQLVERMSAAVRRLESEKAASKEEMVRILSQRDEAREEVVNLMREIEGLKGDRERVGTLEKDLKDVEGKYEAVLQLLGERSEENEELKNDVLDLKKIYRELVESTMK
jgi:chromosome segregation ATPase